jgi:hypothetical protein
MASTSLVSDLHFQPGGWRDLATGLLGYLRLCVARVLVVDGATLRMTADGRVTMSWPEQRRGPGRRRAIVWPVNPAVRRAIEAEVIALLGDAIPRGAP